MQSHDEKCPLSDVAITHNLFIHRSTAVRACGLLRSAVLYSNFTEHRESLPYTISKPYEHCYYSRYANVHTSADPDVGSYTNANTNPVAHTGAFSYTHSYTCTHPNAHSHGHAGSYRYGYCNPRTDPIP